MEQNEVSKRLRALAADDKRRPETARLRDVFEDVEAALTAGISQADVLAELHQSGYTMTMASFKSALQRIRKERGKKQPGTTNQATRTAEAATVPVVTAGSGADQAAPAVDDLAGLDSKQRREKIADQFIKSGESQLAKRLLKDKRT